jgi:hypothetical protein
LPRRQDAQKESSGKNPLNGMIRPSSNDPRRPAAVL